ncbi:UNVERIFIED_ORG: asparagine synthase (glutamine-hydrolysing) [Chitinophaga ginsengisegetis]
MTDAIAHRGPDGAGSWINEDQHLALGHRRLSIIDLSDSGHQPMHYAEGRYTITYNGEIYNYLELKEMLTKQGYEFVSNSDTEVLLALYDAKKEACLNLLDGMFAFAIWDSREKTLFFARDRFGEKPFHYAYSPGECFIFGSEMKSIWAYGQKKEVNNKMYYRYLAYGEIMHEEDLAETFFEGIKRLKPAHYGKIGFPDLTLQIQSYWTLNRIAIDENISQIQAVERFRELFLNSVTRRLRSDVPVGSSLSGGLDSSLVVCAIDHLSLGNHRQHTFSARFPGFSKDEGEFMNKVITRVNASAHFAFPNGNDFLTRLQEIAWHQEEPFGSASICVQNDVMRLAKERNIKVLLDGQGADEILAGYPYYFYSFFRELKKGNRTIFNTQLSEYHKLSGNGNAHNVYPYSFKTRVKNTLPDSLVRQIIRTKRKIDDLKDPFINRDFSQAYRVDGSKWPINPDTLNLSLQQSVSGSGLQELLRYADRNSMAHSREVRLPFLSHEFVEFVFSLPAAFKISNGWTKYLMRLAFKDILPNEITWRKDKIGYEPPQQQWMQNKAVIDFTNSMKEKLIKDRILSAAILDERPDRARSIYENKNWQILVSGMLF